MESGQMSKAVGFEPHFDHDMKRGEVGEALLDLFFEDAENGVKFEVKTDYRVNETGNFYVETEKFRTESTQEPVPSGINVTDSKWWVQASPTGDMFLVMKTDKFREYIEFVNPPKASQPISNRNSAASNGVLVSVKGMMKWFKMWKATD
jgi:hypothetical protein